MRRVEQLRMGLRTALKAVRYRVALRSNTIKTDTVRSARVGQHRLWVDTADRGIGRPLIMHGGYEVGLSEQIRRLLAATTSSFFVDIGANIGVHTVACGADRTLAFEPDPVNAGLLSRSVRDNGLEDRVEVCTSAVSDVAGIVTLYKATTNHGMHALARENLLSETCAGTVSCSAVVLDDFLQERYPGVAPTVLKIDVQGHEAEVLRGARFTIEKYHPAIILDAEPDDEKVQMLDAQGYAVAFIDKTTGEPTGRPEEGEATMVLTYRDPSAL